MFMVRCIHIALVSSDVQSLCVGLQCPSYLPNSPIMSLRGIKEAKAPLSLPSGTLDQESLTGSKEGFIFCMHATHALLYIKKHMTVPSLRTYIDEDT